MAVDHQSAPLERDKPSERNLAHHVSNAAAAGYARPPESELRRAAEILNSARKVTILAGRGTLGSENELAEVSDRLAAPVAKALLGKAAMADDHPNCTGGVGLLGTAPSQDALGGCDALLILGSTFPYIEFYPKPGHARGVQIDRDGQRLGLRYPVECGLLGDMGPTLRALLPMLERKTDRSFLEGVQRAVAEWNDLLDARAKPDQTPMRGDTPAAAISSLLEDDAIVTTDCGVNTAYAARHIKMRPGMMFSTSGTLASMGAGLPYAIAAKIAHPDRQVVAFVGDGGLTMTIGEMATAMKYGADVKVVLIKNDSLGQIKWEQLAFLGNPEYACDLQPVDFAAVARGFGWTAWSVTDPAQVASVLTRALATSGPVLVEVAVDKNDPLLPPKIEPRQAINMAKALAKGAPGREAILKNIVREAAREVI